MHVMMQSIKKRVKAHVSHVIMPCTVTCKLHRRVPALLITVGTSNESNDK